MPFMTLNATARTQTAQYQLSRLSSLSIFSGRNIRNITFAPGTAEGVAILSNDAYPAQNGRGVTKYVESYVLPQVVAALDNYERQNKDKVPNQDKDKAQDKGTQRGIVLQVSAPKGSVYHKAKFTVTVDEVTWTEKKQSWWSKWSGKPKTEL